MPVGLNEARRGNRPRLLVSVRSGAEAEAALTGGADIIDVKDPAQGPLGCSSLAVIAEVAQMLRNHSSRSVPLSAALGELREYPPRPELPADCAWVKFGLSGLAKTDWNRRWAAVRQELRALLPQTQLIPVIYADWRTCSAPPPQEVMGVAREADIPGILFDTYHKRGNSLLDHLSIPDLSMFIAEIHAADRFVALAGSIDIPQLPDLIDLRPDILAVRSAACVGGRLGRVDAQRVAALVAAISELRTK